MKGELVDRAKAVAHVFKLARDERDAWVDWPAPVSAIGDRRPNHTISYAHERQ